MQTTTTEAYETLAAELNIPTEIISQELAILAKSRHWIINRDKVKDMRVSVSHLELDGMPKESLAPTYQALDAMGKLTDKLGRQVDKLVLQHPIGEWISQINGMSHRSFGEVLFLIKAPFFIMHGPHALNKWFGLHVVNGQAPRKTKGQRTGFNPRCKGWVYNTGVNIVRSAGSSYRFFYDRSKAMYNARAATGPSECKFGQHHTNKKGETIKCTGLHVENAARRYATKKLLRDLWLAYHKRLATGMCERREAELLEKYGVVLDHEIGESRAV